MNKSFIKVLVTIVVIILIIIGVTRSSNKKTENAFETGPGLYPGTLKVGHLVAIDMAPMFIAKEAGYFDDEGLDVETIFFSNPGDNNAALAGGSTQLMINPFTLAYLGDNSGVPMKIVANAGGNGVMQVVVQGKYNIKNMDELVTYVKAHPNEKLKVGTLRGDTLDMILYKSFKDHGLTYDDFEMIWFDDLLAMVQSFKTNDIAILSHIQPYTNDLQMNYGAKLLTDNAIVWGEGTPNTTLVALDDFAKKYPETMKRFLRAENKAIELIKNNPEKAVQILAGKNYYKTPDNVLLAAFKTQNNATLRPNVDGMMMAINDMVKQNYIKAPTINIVDTSYLDAALK
jgi:ABC-type nitrate/sulfonate/bicarbonate transport system substrate-binding protein